MDSNIQKKIDHVIVLMLENRSLDNLMGWLYENKEPKNFLPQDTPEALRKYNGLSGLDYSNRLDLEDPESSVDIVKGVSNFRVPNPVPNESFAEINRQQYGLEINKDTEGWLPKEEGIVPSMKGFLADYVTAKCSDRNIAPQIMETYTADDLSVISGIAKEYAISDNYHASCPTQTWPNRAFMHTGTSEGHVNNSPYLPYTSKTIFNVLQDEGVSWRVYKSSHIIPSLTRIQMTQLWSPKLDGHFDSMERFYKECKTGELPAYSFLEPSFVLEKGDAASSEHPPANVCAGELFLQQVWEAVVTSKNFERTLFIINFDEHGGCPDHVPPNWTAVPPDDKSQPGDLGFNFNRYGVRVPAIFVSPHIKKSTCVRASTQPWDVASVPFDHTSILAMILDWKKIDRNKVLGQRVSQSIPNPFDELLTGDARVDRPLFKASCTFDGPGLLNRFINFCKGLFGLCSDDGKLSSLQKCLLCVDAHYRAAQKKGFAEGEFASSESIHQLLQSVKTEKDILAHFEKYKQ
ncbi:hypothetical protein MNBD_GAMMA12-2733 [hydrothermal vent metagenome]|uniref:Phospholipase C n=1 Tax=hydrothermal vent metagenome TaxID=652676 RepID=A0A3B0YCL9_9ZZZZ